MLQWSGELMNAAADLGSVSIASPLLQRAYAPPLAAGTPASAVARNPAIARKQASRRT
jgi:hypothetical protein